MQTKLLLAVGIAGAFVLPAVLMWFDVEVGPPSGVWHVLLWPVDLLLWASGPGTPLSNGRFEWTPVQDFAASLGAGLTWLFWAVALRMGLRVTSPHS